MWIVWVILFIIKIYSRKDIFKLAKTKLGKDIFNVARPFENVKTNYANTILDVTFIPSCKTDHILPTFTKVRLPNKNGKLKKTQLIGCIIMEMNKEVSIKKRKRNKQKAIAMWQEKNLIHWQKCQNKYKEYTNNQFLKNVVNKFSSYSLSEDKTKVLSFRSDQYITYKIVKNTIETKFDKFLSQHFTWHFKHSAIQPEQYKNKITIYISEVVQHKNAIPVSKNREARICE